MRSPARRASSSARPTGAGLPGRRPARPLSAPPDRLITLETSITVQISIFSDFVADPTERFASAQEPAPLRERAARGRKWRRIPLKSLDSDSEIAPHDAARAKVAAKGWTASPIPHKVVSSAFLPAPRP